MNIQESLKYAKNIFKNSSTPLLDAELILCHVLKCQKTTLITNPDQELTLKQVGEFDQLIDQRKQGKPIAYITNEKEFFGRNFYVDERVLIPRPETEEMVEDGLAYLKINPHLNTIIDLGSGSGAIAITLAVESRESRVYGLEISEKALEVAEINLERYPCENLQFLRSDLLMNLPSILDARPLTILANLPYIGTSTNRFISEETEKYEPHVALFGGTDGLELYRKTWEQIKVMNLKVAALFMEIGFSQAEIMEKEVRAKFPEYHFEIKNDLAGLPRTAILTSRLLL